MHNSKTQWIQSLKWLQYMTPDEFAEIARMKAWALERVVRWARANVQSADRDSLSRILDASDDNEAVEALLHPIGHHAR